MTAKYPFLWYLDFLRFPSSELDDELLLPEESVREGALPGDVDPDRPGTSPEADDEPEELDRESDRELESLE